MCIIRQSFFMYVEYSEKNYRPSFKYLATAFGSTFSCKLNFLTTLAIVFALMYIATKSPAIKTNGSKTFEGMLFPIFGNRCKRKNVAAIKINSMASPRTMLNNPTQILKIKVLSFLVIFTIPVYFS